ncbi:RICIN domain-containing protein [Streptacidiphilus sp. P02-A3a]|uniref:RICIN domain-containing protein n=1 Tax=Streptacidiphilus sp. P02-A3a TaxID=2704468 RepID=UPI001CDC63CA|nr:RICIN domain-containing protein [Streptacidiphilus sp. P02-A3a]
MSARSTRPAPKEPVRRRLVGALAALALATLGVSALTAAPASATAATPSYTVNVGSIGSFGNPDDTPASPFVDKDGTFYYQESNSLYGATDSRKWNFYTGTDFDTATADSALDNAVNPANSQDSNADTTWRCDNSPTGLEATAAPSGSGYAEVNYCDLVGVWVDPDTGNWYGLVHDEFTPQPFGDGLHYDSIDYAVSTDQGKVWTIEGHAITSPYSTDRGDTTAFPNQTYDYGDGDPRLFVDTASGYFYVYYGSRIVPKGGVGGSTGGLAHVARAPISGKMATGTWQKWYDGAWSQPGVGGQESNMVPATSAAPTGYTPVGQDYDPANTGTVDQQVAAGELPSKSPLFIMNIAYDAYLGLYLGEPEVVNTSTPQPQQFYATANLATQQWTLIGDSGSYTSDSWYRWFLDNQNLTSSTIVGESFRSYCAIACAGSSGEYANLTVGSSAPAATLFNPADTYRIASADGQFLGQVSGSSATASQASASGSTLQAWSFVADGDGSYQIVNAGTGQLLGVGSSSTGSRAWGTAPTVTATGGTGPTVGQQWWVIPDTSSSSGATSGSYRLVNRYSGLVVGLTTGSGAVAETTPARYWTNTTGNSVGGSRTSNEQTLTVTAVGTTAGTVTVNPIGAQSWTDGTAVNLQATAASSTGATPAYSAVGLPAGVTVNSGTGLISGTPSSTGSGTATVTATAGAASGATTFSWSVAAPSLPNGSYTVLLQGQALEDPDSSTTEARQLDTSALTGAANQQWTFTQQSDGSYQLVNGSSGQCMDDNGGFTTAGTTVIQWPCSGASNQHWTVAQLSSGAYTLTNAHSGLLLTTASTGNGALVTQQPNTGSALQQWTPAANVTGSHTVALQGEALEDPNSSSGDGIQLDTSALTGAANQNWAFTQQSDGSYQLVNGSSGQCMDDNGGFTTAGTTVIQWPCSGASNQHWTVSLLANGGYTLTNVHTGLLLTTASTGNGALVTQQPNTGSALQQWTVH